MNWTVNGGDVLYGENAQLDGSTEFDRDEVITVTVTPFNTALTLAGTPVTSSALTVSTPPPTAPQLTIDPLEPLAGIDDLLCEVDVPSVDDDDNDAISYTMTWTVDGAPFTTPLTHTWPGDAIAAADTSEGETWVCTATPSDGTDTGPIATTSVTILKSFSGWIPAAQALSQADHIFNGDYPNDSMGWDVAFVGDVDGGGTEDILIGQPDGNYLGSGEVGTSHLFLGENLSMASYDAADADYIFGSASWCEWGYGAQPAGDIDGDGYADLIIAGPTCDVIGVTDNGLVAIISASEFLGSTSAPNIDILLESNAWVFYGEESYAFLGRGRSQNSNNSNNNTNQSLHGGLDVSGDGTPDVIFGTNIKNVRQGVTYVVLGENLGVAGTWESAGNSDYIISGVDGDSGIEVELVPDVDGDGFAEFMIGAPKCQASPRGGFIGNSNSAGAAYLFFGGDLASPGARQLGVATDSNVYFTGKGNYGGGLFGQSVAGVEDMDGDGYAEVAVGAPWADLAGSHSGGVFLYSASQVQAEDYFAGNGGQIDSANASWTLEGKTGDHELGADMSTAGDVDNDGLGDLIIGVESDSTGTHPLGGSYLAMGADLVANGSSAMDFTTWATYRFKEPTQDNHAYQVDGGADFNQDGLDDLLIGARFYDSNGQTDAGAAFLFLAP